MVTDQQVRRLMKLKQSESTLAVAAAKAGMDEKTARKYLHANKLPSEMRADHTWRTREDPFVDVWAELTEMLEINSDQSTFKNCCCFLQLFLYKRESCRLYQKDAFHAHCLDSHC